MKRCLLYLVILLPCVSDIYASNSFVEEVEYDPKYLAVGAAVGAGSMLLGVHVAAKQFSENPEQGAMGHIVYGACIGGALTVGAECLKKALTGEPPDYFSQFMAGVSAGFVCGNHSSQIGHFLGKMKNQGIPYWKHPAGVASLCLAAVIGAGYGADAMGKRVVHHPPAEL
ncbi:MAG: hypothetical protein LBF65_02025 [Holosporales bacterium]|jgi:hypothetical protein|nr:hypothetical protein [Holosporales bacterium]